MPAVAEAVVVANVGGVRLEAAAIMEAAGAEATTVEAATVEGVAATARISADRGRRQSANHEQPRKCPLDRCSHASLSLPMTPHVLNQLLSTRRHALNF
jgi:hypothetical protein